LFRIALTDIMANRLTTVDDLATKYNVSARTVYRDFDAGILLNSLQKSEIRLPE